MDWLKFNTKREAVLFFINDFKKFNNNSVLEDTFTRGYCYYFALILRERFDGTILYDRGEGHFVTKIGNYLYDINGDVTGKYPRKLLTKEEYMADPEILHGCIMKHIKY